MNAPRPGRRGALLLYCIAAVGLPCAMLLSMLLPIPASVNGFVQLLIFDCIYYLPFIVLPVWIYTRRKPGIMNACRPDGFGIGRLILIALLAGCVFFLCNDVTVLWAIPCQKLGLNIYGNAYPMPVGPRELVLYVIAAAVIPAVCEELLFRGILLSAFEANGTRFAVIAVSVMFAILHGSPLGLPAELIAGSVIAFVAIASDSIYAGMVFHTLYNTITVVMDYLHPAEGGGDLLAGIGGGAGVFSLVCDCVLFIACSVFLLRSMFFRAKLNGYKSIPHSDCEKLRASEIICIALSALAILLLYLFNTMTMLNGVIS